MHDISVQSKALFNLASNVGRVICSKNAVTSLNNFLCTVEGNTLTLTGSDLENSLSGKVEIFDSWGDGTFQIDARRLTSLLKELAEQPITISVNEENYEIEVATSTGQYSDETLPANGGIKSYFGKHSFNHSIMILSDMPQTQNGSWFLHYRDKMDDDLILAIQAAGVTRGRNGFRKDKGGEKLAESEDREAG